MMTMPPKEMELVAIGISAAAGCKPSMDGYDAVGQGARATREEFKQADLLAVCHGAANTKEPWPISAKSVRW